MNFAVLACVLVLNVPILLGLGRLLFGGWRGFVDACESLFVIDLSEAMWGHTGEYRPGKFVMLVFVVFAIMSTIVEYHLLLQYWQPSE